MLAAGATPAQHRLPAAPLDLRPARPADRARRTFAHDPCLNLRNYPLQNWNGLLFEATAATWPPTWPGLGPRADLDFRGYVLDHVEVHECNYNWKTFIEVYLEDYHVNALPPRPGQVRHLRRPALGVRHHHSVQTVGVHNALKKAGSPTYRRWHERC
jgi:choline monooxygenase